MLSKIQSESHRPFSESSASLASSIALIDWLLLFRIIRPSLGALTAPCWSVLVFEPPSLREYLLRARLRPPSSTGRVWYLAEHEEAARGARRRMGVSLKRGLGLDSVTGVKAGGDWLREVELFRLVLRFSRGVEGSRRAEEALEEALEEGRGRTSVRMVEEVVLEQEEPGLLGAGLRFGLGSDPVGEEEESRAPVKEVFSSIATVVVVGLLAVQVCPIPDVEQSGSGESED